MLSMGQKMLQAVTRNHTTTGFQMQVIDTGQTVQTGGQTFAIAVTMYA